MAKANASKVHAVLARVRRAGRWRLGPRLSILAVLGSCRLDLRQAKFDEPTTRVTAFAILGSVRVVVPSGVEVRPSGLSLLGSSRVDVPDFDDELESGLLELDWTVVLGRLILGTAAELGLDELVDPPTLDRLAESVGGVVAGVDDGDASESVGGVVAGVDDGDASESDDGSGADLEVSLSPTHP